MLFITLGADHGIIIDDHPVEFNIEHIFRALNRIGDIDQDEAQLLDLAGPHHGWLWQLRRALDTCRAPSMSVGEWPSCREPRRSFSR